ncbi:MAG: hypothetical protein ACPGF7_15520 [Pontibacterium sp.]
MKSQTAMRNVGNVLTVDKGTSGLAQGPVAHSCLVGVERVLDD